MPTAQSNNYDNEIASLQDDIDNLTDNLLEQIDDLQTQLDDVILDVEDRIAEWEETQETIQEEEETDADVKWSWTINSNYSESDIVIDYWQTPSRMDYEGDYAIKVTLTNKKTILIGGVVTPVAITDLALDITFSPDGHPYIDSKNTFLDTVSRPYTLWDTDIVTRGDDEYCQRISNVSENIQLGAGETLPLTLEFILTYK